MHSREELASLVKCYLGDVADGRRIVGRFERLAVQRHLQDLNRASGELEFHESDALAALRFAERFVHHTKGEWAGRRFEFCSRSAWIAFILWSLFGWHRRQSDGTLRRRFDEAYICTGRKQGKSMIAAIIALLMYVGQGEAAAEVYFGATQRAQAAIPWKQAAGIVKKDPSLSRFLHVAGGAQRITKHGDFEAAFQPLSRNDDEFDGLNPFCAVLDEVHAYDDSGLYDVLRSGMGARRSPLRVLTTTRGANPEGFCGNYEAAAICVLEGVFDEDTTFVFIASLDEGDDWKDPANWPKANPNIGVTITTDFLKNELKRAINSPIKRNEFLRKHCNVWTTVEKAWLPLEKWDACGSVVDESALAGEPCYVAIDLSKSSDFTAAVRLFPRPDGKLIALPHFWIPSAGLENRASSTKVPIGAWVDRGLVTLTRGEIVDQDAVKEWIRQQHTKHRVVEWAFDPAQAWKLIAELEALGFANVVQFQQKWLPMHTARKATEDAILTGRVVHNRNPVLRWMFTNVVLRENPTGLAIIDKRRSRDKIDGITALVMAVGRADLRVTKESVYTRRGFIVL